MPYRSRSSTDEPSCAVPVPGGTRMYHTVIVATVDVNHVNGIAAATVVVLVLLLIVYCF